jgi:hypothetical protein
MLEEALDQSDLVPAFDAQVASLARRRQRLRSTSRAFAGHLACG